MEDLPKTYVILERSNEFEVGGTPDVFQSGAACALQGMNYKPTFYSEDLKKVQDYVDWYRQVREDPRVCYYTEIKEL